MRREKPLVPDSTGNWVWDAFMYEWTKVDDGACVIKAQDMPAVRDLFKPYWKDEDNNVSVGTLICRMVERIRGDVHASARVVPRADVEKLQEQLADMRDKLVAQQQRASHLADECGRLRSVADKAMRDADAMELELRRRGGGAR